MGEITAEIPFEKIKDILKDDIFHLKVEIKTNGKQFNNSCCK